MLRNSSICEHAFASFKATTLPWVAVVVTAAASVIAAAPQKRVPTLVYLHTSKDAEHAGKLSQCDRLTIDEYTKRGVRVLEKSAGDLAAWLDSEGREFKRATPGVQQVAYARALGTDAVGGLGAWHFTEDDVAGMPDGTEPGIYFHPWGTSLSGIYRSNVFTLEHGDKVQAIPLHLAVDSDDPWSIATRVTPQPCSAGDVAASPSSGRPFLGIALDEATRVTSVTLNSPAAQAGLRVDDVLGSIDGRSIDSLRALVDALEGHKIGDTIELVYVRGQENQTAKVTLADRAAVEALNSPVGKPLPELVGKDIHGREIRTRDLRGKVVLLDVWATWCPPCVEGAPVLQLLWEHAGKRDDFVWLGVSVDDDEKAWQDFVKHNKLGGTHVLGPEWAETLAVNGFPTILLVDRNGMVRCELHEFNLASATLALLEAR